MLITGGCGFLGYYLITKITKEYPKLKIRVIDLKENPLKNFKINNKQVEIILNKDITNENSIKDSFKDVDVVIHLAGLVSFSLKDKEKLYKVNVKGTKNVIKLSEKNKVKKFIHVSSVAALGFIDKKDSFVDENFIFDWRIAKKRQKYYMLSKYLGDKIVKSYKDKMDLLILYPGLMWGPGDIKNLVRLMIAIKQRRIPFNMPGGTNIVDVRDVAEGIVLALKKEKTGEYLLSGENHSFININKTIAKTIGTSPPRKTLPKFMNFPLFHLIKIIERIKKDLELTADNIDSSFKYRYFKNEKAKKEFGWSPKIILEKTIKDTHSWIIRENGSLKK